MTTRVEASEESAATWAAKPFVADEIREAVAAADILIVPSEGYAEREDLRFFPQGTSELFDFLKSRAASDVRVEVAATDADYREVARHAGVLYLAQFILTNVAAPVFATLLADYILTKVGRRKDSTTIKTSITLRDDATQRSMRLDYDGPATAFPDTIIAVSKQLQSGETTPLLTDDSTRSSQPDQSAPAEVSRETEH